MKDFLDKLKGGDHRSLGPVNDVVAMVLGNTDLFEPLFNAICEDDPLLRMRAADAVEKITNSRPDLLQPFKARLLGDLARIEQPQVRWHVAQLLPRLEASSDERKAMVDILTGYLTDNSKIVKTCAMQALADLCLEEPALGERIIPLLHELTETGSPAMRARGRTLMNRLWKSK